MLFLGTNIAIIAMLSIVANLLGVNRYLVANGINYQALLGFALVFGFGGAFISLLLSKTIAKWSMGLKLINGSENARSAWLYQTVANQAQEVGIGMPEVAIYESPEMNAFATGASKNKSLVAVSTGLLNNMRDDEIRAVLGHEVAHIANGDMVTMTLLQGVLNTFVIFAARVVGYFVDQFINGDKEDNSPGIGYMITSLVLEIVFGLLASTIVAWYSRVREFKADAGGASLAGRQSMINALARLGGHDNELAGGLNGFGISGKSRSLLSLFATHPPIEKRIAALKAMN